jgi:broad specificity phosphatase PhoE
MARAVAASLAPTTLAMAAQLIRVVRHAHAGNPAAWQHDDDLRPLSDRGCGQAVRLVQALGADRPAVIYSSPSLRCVATILPLARAHRLPVATLDELYEGGTATGMLARLARDGSPAVACTHGDVMEDLFRLIVAAGIEVASMRAEKGSTVTIQLEDGRLRSASYAPPP